MCLEEKSKAASEAEAQLELLKLREELFRSRRAEAQKDRELVFMQRQLCEAAGKIAKLMDGGAEGQQTDAARVSSVVPMRKRGPVR